MKPRWRKGTETAQYWLADLNTFSDLILGKPLRPYQLEAAQAICRSILHGSGHTFAVMMARQAGKNELSAQLETYLLNLYKRRGGQIVKASPTYKPQTINSLLRLLDRLENPWNRGRTRRREGYIVEFRRARCLFFSAEPTARVVGATADVLLEADEAQDILAEKYYRDFAPMAASTNATTVMYGTAWTSDTLLARTIEHLRVLEKRDGMQRVFAYDADQVARHVPAYGLYVAQQVARLGRDHPLIKTQYYLETMDAGGGLFPPARMALMRGDHVRRHGPAPEGRSPAPGCEGPEEGGIYALLLDVAGEEEAEGAAPARMMLQNPRRDATALTIVQILPQPHDLPHYRCVDRHLYLGVKHTALHDRIVALAAHWRARYVVVDATGIGAGLASFLEKALPNRVLPVLFTAKTKSDLGWRFLGAIETGRYKEYVDDGEPDTRQFWYEVKQCQYEIVPGPGQRLRWGNWEAPSYQGPIARGHDDLLISAALCTLLDDQDPATTGTAAIPYRTDPLDEIDQTGW